ncbi:MAG: DNA gyrase subunit A [Ilumatobacteraceae bacterium]
MSDTPNPPDNSSDDGLDPIDPIDPIDDLLDTSLATQPITLQDEMERSFLDYAMSVIMARALPDVRDGLKPVHRRIIWDMEEQGFRPDRAFVKSARVSGDTMAKYHPHGDGAIYDALVRMAQPFSLRHPLIDFHGNYGSPDFGPAASRYTECRLHPLAMQLLADIDEDTVDMTPTYDGSRTEPVVLPARFPNLLVNGSQGIAVGMATNIPPHNLGEVIDATIHLIDHDDATTEDLMQFVKGPDFPTGGSILGRAGIIDAYTTGRGSVKMRATATIEETRRGGFEIVVTALPYQTSCSAIAGRIQELVDGGDLDGISDVNDGSSGGKTNLVISLKRDANPNVVLNNLYKLTQLQTSFGVNMVALVDGVPRTLNLRSALVGYVSHQVEVITRRTTYRLGKAKEREHKVEGRLKALNVIDEIIALIRASDDAGAAKESLMVAPFEFSEIQALDILDMQLRQLTRLSRIDLERELGELQERILELQSILDDPEKLRGVIKSEMLAVREAFATPRKCQITLDTGEMSIEDLVDDTELVIVMTEAQYVKAVPAANFKTQGRGGRGVSGGKMKADDLVRHVIFTTAHAFLLFFSNRGKVYRLRAMDVPERERTAKGMPIVNLLPLQAGETIQAIIDTRDFASERYLFFATKQGTVKKTAFNEYDSSRRDGLIAINLRGSDELVRVIETSGSDDIFMVGRSGMTVRFNEASVRPMGRGAGGVRGMKMRTGDEVVSVDVVRDDTALLLITAEGFGKRTMLDEFTAKGRAGLGVIGIKINERKGKVVAAFMVGDDDDIVAVSSGGVTIRMPVADISMQGRNATGVRVMNLDDGQIVASVAPIFASDEIAAESSADGAIEASDEASDESPDESSEAVTDSATDSATDGDHSDADAASEDSDD